MIRPDESDTKTTWYYVVVIRITLRTDGTLGGFPWKKRRSLASPIHQSQTILATLIVIMDPNNFSEYSLFFKMLFSCLFASPSPSVTGYLPHSHPHHRSQHTNYLSLTNILYLPSSYKFTLMSLFMQHIISPSQHSPSPTIPDIRHFW